MSTKFYQNLKPLAVPQINTQRLGIHRKKYKSCIFSARPRIFLAPQGPPKEPLRLLRATFGHFAQVGDAVIYLQLQ